MWAAVAWEGEGSAPTMHEIAFALHSGPLYPSVCLFSQLALCLQLAACRQQSPGKDIALEASLRLPSQQHREPSLEALLRSQRVWLAIWMLPPLQQSFEAWKLQMPVGIQPAEKLLHQEEEPYHEAAPHFCVQILRER